MNIEFKVVDYKVYFLEYTKEQLIERAINYKYSEKNKKWADDFDDMLDKKFNVYSDVDGVCGVYNKQLMKTVFKGEKSDINSLYDSCRKLDRYWTCNLKRLYGLDDITDEIIKSHFEIVIPEKPTTYPKYSNEVPFKYDKRTPEIIKIYYDGYRWQYKLKNVGHEYEFVTESEIDKYNV